MCNCVKEIKEKLRERHLSNSTSKDEIISSVNFSHEAFFSTGAAFPVGIPVEITSTFEKVDGTRSRPRKKDINMFATFCPFCGLNSEGLPAEPTSLPTKPETNNG